MLTSSYKKVAKEASEEIMEKGTKSLSKEFTEESLENTSKRELKTITWEDFYKVIAKKMPSLALKIKYNINGEPTRNTNERAFLVILLNSSINPFSI